MTIQVIGLNSHTAPMSTRELFAFDQHGVQERLALWRKQFPDVEATLLSTCNRTELYFATEAQTNAPEFREVFPFLVARTRRDSQTDVSFDGSQTYLQTFKGFDAASHLFAVASSLESMILGEPQILSQVKNAYEIAVQAQATGPILNEAFQTAFKTAKRVSVETDLFKRRVSIPSVAIVDFALNIFEKLSDKSTLVLGAGEMAEETLKYLVEYGAQQITVANRSRDKAIDLAQRYHGKVADWQDRFDLIEHVDLIICATGATEPIVTLQDYQRLEAKRKHKPLFILDLSAPRNIDPELGKRPDVYLYCVDDLENACKKNQELRDKEIPKARIVIQEEAKRFIEEIEARQYIDAIKDLRDAWNHAKEIEVQRLLRKINCSEEDQQEIRYAFDKLVNKLLHSPTVSLRDAAKSESAPKIVELARRLFRL
ncbi:MAG: glutamyl-tRNA reductase [Planctomycetia bacterium]|nr:glutamyl-tRNA reductase [Planctomycetia bacterium]